MGIKDGQTDRSSAIFDQFCRITSLRGTLTIFQQLCEEIQLDRTDHRGFYASLRSKLHSWRAASLWNKLDKRLSQEVYKYQTLCAGHRAFVIGAGPCGLRTAIELSMLGCKVVVVEKRDSFSRNNVIHLWPFVIHDLRSLGAKKFYGKFCSGSIDHISIKQVQLVLCKIALLLGVEIHINTSFEGLVPPTADIGWRANVLPNDHPINLYEFDIMIGADGRRNVFDGFPRKEFRGKLAIGITANFVNSNSKAEAQVEEISGLSYIYNQRFFQELKHFSGIDLENIVYYKDETHYFVMTAKKQSLLAKGVLIKDHQEISSLLVRENVNQTALFSYAREAARAATENQLPELEFALNSHGESDVAMFDFTSLFAAENASRIVTRKSYPLVQALVGDSLLEPFWPTGTGCARGFLSSLDAAWMIRQWSIDVNPLEIIAERESLYQLLSQTTSDNMNKNYSSITINPKSRYQKLISTNMKPSQVKHLYDDDGTGKKSIINLNIKAEKAPESKPKYFGDYDRILRWFQLRLRPYEKLVTIDDLSTSWLNGRGLYCILHHFHPELVDLKIIDEMDDSRTYQRACDIIEKAYDVSPRVTANEIAENSVDSMKMFQYLTDVCHIMAVKHKRHHSHEHVEEKKDERERTRRVIHTGPSRQLPRPRVDQKVEHRPLKRPATMISPEAKMAAVDVFMQVTGGRPRTATTPTRSPPPRSRQVANELFFSGIREECGSQVSEVKMRIKTDDAKTREEKRSRRYSDMPLNRPGIEDVIKQMNERKEKRSLEAKELFQKELEKIRSPNTDAVREFTQCKNDPCYICSDAIQPLERMNAEGYFIHKNCLKCTYCKIALGIDEYAFRYGSDGGGLKFYCFRHVGMSRESGGQDVKKTKDALENVKLRNRCRNSEPDSPDGAPARGVFSPVKRRSIIEDNSWNLRDFLYSADMDDELVTFESDEDEEYDSENDEDDEEEETTSSSEEEEVDEENNELRGFITDAPSRGAVAHASAKASFFSQPSQPVRIDPWAFFEREMGFKLVVKDTSNDKQDKAKSASSHPDSDNSSPEWDDTDLTDHDGFPAKVEIEEKNDENVKDENFNPASITIEDAAFMDEGSSSDNPLNDSKEANNLSKDIDESTENVELENNVENPASSEKKLFPVITAPKALEEEEFDLAQSNEKVNEIEKSELEDNTKDIVDGLDSVKIENSTENQNQNDSEHNDNSEVEKSD